MDFGRRRCLKIDQAKSIWDDLVVDFAEVQTKSKSGVSSEMDRSSEPRRRLVTYWGEGIATNIQRPHCARQLVWYFERCPQQEGQLDRRTLSRYHGEAYRSIWTNFGPKTLIAMLNERSINLNDFWDVRTHQREYTLHFEKLYSCQTVSPNC